MPRQRDIAQALSHFSDHAEGIPWSMKAFLFWYAICRACLSCTADDEQAADAVIDAGKQIGRLRLTLHVCRSNAQFFDPIPEAALGYPQELRGPGLNTAGLL